MNPVDFPRHKNDYGGRGPASGGKAAARLQFRKTPQDQHEIDPLQKFLWGALIVSFPFTAVSIWPARMKTFGQPAVLLALLLIGLILFGAMLPHGRVFIPRGRSVILLAVFLLIVGLSFFVNYPMNPYMWPGHSPWAKSAKQLTQWFTDGVVVYLTLRFVRTWRDFRFALKCYFLGFLCTVGAGVLNIATIHWPAGHAASIFGLLHNGAWSGATSRLTLLAYEPSMAGDYLLSIVPLLVCGAFYWKSRWWTVVWSVVGIALFWGTFSFGCFGALFVAAIVVGVVYARRGSKGLIAGVVLLLLVVVTAVVSSSKGEQFLGGRISDILESGMDPSNISSFSTRQRLASAEATFNIFLEHPLTGVGVGKSPFYIYAAYPVWALNQGDVAGSTFNGQEAGGSGYAPGNAISFNLFVQTLAEMGLIGGVVFVALLLSMLADCYGVLNNAQEKWKRKVFVGILFALVAQIIHYNAMSWLDFRYWFFIWGLAICAPRLLRQKDPQMSVGRLILRGLSDGPALRGESHSIKVLP